MKMFNLAGKVAIVTGGNGGIGLAMAEGIGVCGAAIMIAARDVGKAKLALEKLQAAGVSEN
jgi:2-deoxy-D-gluconate 3-dehydrogenase